MHFHRFMVFKTISKQVPNTGADPGIFDGKGPTGMLHLIGQKPKTK